MIHSKQWVFSATASLFVLVLITAGEAQLPSIGNVTSPNPDLVGKLTKDLNITPTQAIGGAGAIFGLAKTRLSSADFGKVASAVPGMDGFLQAAPKNAASSSPLGSLGSMVGGQAGGLASLAASFQSLGLSPSMATKFVPILQNYIGAKGGANVASVFAGALK